MPRRHVPLASLALALFLAAAAHSAELRLVADVDPRLGTSDATYPNAGTFLPVGPRTLFVVSPTQAAPGDPSEIWGTDGTTAGTERLASFAPLYAAPVFLGASSRYAFFFDAQLSDSSGQVRLALRRTDGTGPGTVTLGSFDLPYNAPNAEGTVLGENLYFAGCTVTYGCEPWISDGTPAGTRRLREITPGSFGSAPRGFLPFGSSIFFWANDPTGAALWRSDGNPAGTVRVATLPPFSDPGPLHLAAGRLFFLDGQVTSYSQLPHLNLWTSDGTTAGTRPLPPFDRGRSGGAAAVRLLGALGNGLAFLGADRRFRTRLWWTDGTARGTRQIDARPADGLLYQREAAFAVLPGGMVFPGPNGEPWRTRGTSATTGPLVSCRRTCGVTVVQDPNGPPPFTTVGGRAFFSAYGPGGEAAEPWVTDGTPAGTHRLVDACPGDCGSYPQFSAGPSGEVYFSDVTGRLWRSDGTSDGTRILLAGEPRATLGPAALASVGPGHRTLLFATASPDRGGEIWRLDALTGRAEPVARTSDGIGSNPILLGPAGGGALFYACDGGGGAAIWNGGLTAPPLRLVSTQFCFDSDSYLESATLGRQTFFPLILPDHYAADLFRTDGTVEGTVQLTHFENRLHVGQILPWRDGVVVVAQAEAPEDSTVWFARPDSPQAEPILPGGISAYSRLWADGDFLYFVRVEGERAKLWRSDGTEAGSVQLADIGYANGYTEVRNLVHLGAAAFLVILGEPGGLWRSDGTPEGTHPLLPDPRLPFETGWPAEPAAFRDGIYYLGEVSYPEPSVQLVRTPGRLLGTAVVRRFAVPGTFPAPSTRITVLGDAFYFVADDGEHGPELWRSDGTATGTRLIRDIRPGREGSRIEGLFAGGGRLYFGADDGEHGVELWRSDGTEEGTVRLADLAQGPSSSFPRGFELVDGTLYFSADDGVVGREPWALPLNLGPSTSVAPRRRH